MGNRVVAGMWNSLCEFTRHAAMKENALLSNHRKYRADDVQRRNIPMWPARWQRRIDSASPGIPSHDQVAQGQASWMRVVAQRLHIAILFLLPMPRLTADFFHQPYAFHPHAAIDGFAHVINCEQRDLYRR